MADRDDVDPAEESSTSTTKPTPTHGSTAFDPTDALQGDSSVADSHDADSHDSDSQVTDVSGEFDDAHSDLEPIDPEPLNSELTDPELEPDATDGFTEPDDVRGMSDDPELVSVGALSETTKSAAGRSGSTSLARVKKEKATPRQKQTGEAAPRTGPVTFVKESAAELRKVVYPTGQQLLQYFVVVLIFVLFIIGIVSLLDLAFGAAIIRIFS